MTAVKPAVFLAAIFLVGSLTASRAESLRRIEIIAKRFTYDPDVITLKKAEPVVNSDGSSIFNAKRGVVPVKFKLTQNGTQTCALPPATISVTRTAGGTEGPIDEASYLSPADNGSNFRITDCQYIYNLASNSLGVGAYRVDISINGQVVGSGSFALK